MIAVKFTRDGFDAKMTAILGVAKNPRAIMAAAGREGANQLKDHFRQKDRESANKLGGARQHFWNQIAQSVSAPVTSADGHTVTISITDGRFAQKLFGGTITAKRVHNLALPQAPEAYGRAPAVFEKETGLTLFFFKKNDRAYLAIAHLTSATGVKVEYLLTPSVSQDADPTALPPQEEFENAILDRAQKVLDRQLAGGTEG